MREFALFFWAMLAFAGLCAWNLRAQWKILKSRHPDRRIQYSITDIYAAILGLMPAIILAALLLQETIRGWPAKQSIDMLHVMMWLIIALGQAAGVCIGKIDAELYTVDDRPTAMKSAGWIIAGALIGGAISTFYLALTCVFINN